MEELAIRVTQKPGDVPELDVGIPFIEFVHLYRDGKGSKTELDIWMAETGIKWPEVFYDSNIETVTLRFADPFSAIAFKMRWA